MTKKKTVSDELKKIFAENGGGNEKDWRRLSKKKTPQGQWVREFANAKIGVKLEVVEMGEGRFVAHRLTEDANANFAGSQQPKNDTQGAIASVNIDHDPERQQFADEVVGDMEEKGYCRQTALIKNAGLALANRFVFAIGREMIGIGLYAYIAPKDIDYDQHLENVIGHLLPRGHGGEVTEMTFDFSGYSSAKQLLSDLQACGFVWDKGLQEDIDPGMLAEVTQKPGPHASGRKPAL